MRNLAGTIWEDVALPAGEINRHDDHEGNCLCCEHLSLEFEGDYSDVTPGAGVYYACGVGVFGIVFPDDIAEIFPLGRICGKFVPRKKEH